MNATVAAIDRSIRQTELNIAELRKLYEEAVFSGDESRENRYDSMIKANLVELRILRQRRTFPAAEEARRGR